MRRAGTVLRHEFVSTVRRKGYLIATLGMPGFLLLYGFVVSIPVLLSSRHEKRVQTIGLVSQAPGVALPESLTTAAPGAPDWLPPSRGAQPPGTVAVGAIHFQAFPDTAAARAALATDRIAAYYVLPDSYVATGTLLRYGRARSPVSDHDVESGAVERLLRRSLLAGRVDEAALERAVAPQGPRGRPRTFELADGVFSERGTADRLVRVFVPLAFAILLMIAIFTSSGMLLLGVVEEKENRVMEILLSSVTPLELFLGKLLGLGAAGLLQLVVWVGSAFVLSIGVLPYLVSAGFTAHIPLLVWVACALFFAAGYLQYGSLMVGFGSLGNNIRESRQLSLVWTMISIIPLVMLGGLLEDPNGGLARALSFIPLTAPVTMMIRLGAGEVPTWEVLVSLGAVVLGAWISLRVTAKLFRIGVLLYGKRPTLPEILRWARA